MVHIKILAAVAALSLSLPSANLLRRELKAGQVDEYVVQCSNTTIPADGMPGDPRTLKISWKAAYKVGEGESGKPLPLEVGVTDYTLGGDAKVVKQPDSTRTIKGTIDDRNHIVVTDAQPAPPSTTIGWLVADMLELPEGQVSIGDTWDVEVQKGVLLGDGNVKLPAKLTGETEYEGHQAWVVTIDKKQVPVHQKVKLRVNGEEATKEGTVTGTADVSVKALIEKGTCRTLSVTAKVHKEQELSVEGASIASKNTIEYASTFKLKS